MITALLIKERRSYTAVMKHQRLIINFDDFCYHYADILYLFMCFCDKETLIASSFEARSERWLILILN